MANVYQSYNNYIVNGPEGVTFRQSPLADLPVSRPAVVVGNQRKPSRQPEASSYVPPPPVAPEVHHHHRTLGRAVSSSSSSTSSSSSSSSSHSSSSARSRSSSTCSHSHVRSRSQPRVEGQRMASQASYYSSSYGTHSTVPSFLLQPTPPLLMGTPGKTYQKAKRHPGCCGGHEEKPYKLRRGCM